MSMRIRVLLYNNLFLLKFYSFYDWYAYFNLISILLSQKMLVCYTSIIFVTYIVIKVKRFMTINWLSIWKIEVKYYNHILQMLKHSAPNVNIFFFLASPQNHGRSLGRHNPHRLWSPPQSHNDHPHYRCPYSLAFPPRCPPPIRRSSRISFVLLHGFCLILISSH